MEHRSGFQIRGWRRYWKMSISKGIFGDIALSLSGGGYRAAAFHLGTLDMLNELGLVDDIAVLSTVSGGSITGAAFAASRADGLPFQNFYESLYAFLLETNVITQGLERLKTSTDINGVNAMPSLIRAAAQVYASANLLGGRTLDTLRSGTSNIGDIIINATDFHTGNSFRFQSSSNTHVRSGNNNSEIPPEINKIIRVADVVAASACFPSGFEPLRFPGDFTWPKGDDILRIRQNLGDPFDDDIPLMDGGVFDNQGIDSVRNICRRKGAEIGVYIISDTSQRSGNLLHLPVRERHGWISLRVWYLLLVLLAIGSLATFTTSVWDLISTYLAGQLLWYRAIVSHLIPALLSAGVFGMILYGRHRFRQAADDIEQKTGINLWQAVKGLSIPELIELVYSRAKSLIVMSSSVFMKHLRNLAFTSLFADPTMNKKLIPNLIYDIDNEGRWGKEIIGAGLQPTGRLRDLARAAESYETNLWFLSPDDLNALIACGRATICFKLLKYLLRERSQEIRDKTKPEFEFFKMLKGKWLDMNLDTQTHVDGRDGGEE